MYKMKQIESILFTAGPQYPPEQDLDQRRRSSLRHLLSYRFVNLSWNYDRRYLAVSVPY